VEVRETQEEKVIGTEQLIVLEQKVAPQPRAQWGMPELYCPS